MRAIILAIFCLFVAVPVFAAGNGEIAFATYSGASGAIITSSAVNVRGFGIKTFTVSGVKITSSADAPTFKNMSGTAIVECAPTASGPWTTCSTEGATAISKTSNGYQQWEDAAAYIRVKWTASSSAIGKKVKMWLNWVSGG